MGSPRRTCWLRLAVPVVEPRNNGNDIVINNYALPILDQEVVQQQSASIDSISGATVTSDACLQSLAVRD